MKKKLVSSLCLFAGLGLLITAATHIQKNPLKSRAEFEAFRVEYSNETSINSISGNRAECLSRYTRCVFNGFEFGSREYFATHESSNRAFDFGDVFDEENPVDLTVFAEIYNIDPILGPMGYDIKTNPIYDEHGTPKQFTMLTFLSDTPLDSENNPYVQGIESLAYAIFADRNIGAAWLTYEYTGNDIVALPDEDQNLTIMVSEEDGDNLTFEYHRYVGSFAYFYTVIVGNISIESFAVEYSCSAMSSELMDVNYNCYHNYIEYSQEPTCTEDGYYYEQCEYCEDVINYYEYPAEGHIPGEPYLQDWIEPTCYSEGYDHYIVECVNCDEILDDYIVDYPIQSHQLEYMPEQEPTCEEYGWEGYFYCINDGCDYEEPHDTIEPLGHDYYTVPAKEPQNCEDNGWAEHEACNRCGWEEDYEIFEPTGHNMELYEESATCLTDGYRAMVCTYCGYEEEHEVIPASSATHVNDFVMEAQEPTCTEYGWSEYHYCSACGWESPHETYEPTGHNVIYSIDEDTIELGDCTTWPNAYIDLYCEYCGEDFGRKRAYIENYADHVYEDGVCINCGQDESNKCTHEHATYEEFFIESAYTGDCNEYPSLDVYFHCLDCGFEGYRGLYVPGYGSHVYENGVCTICGQEGENDCYHENMVQEPIWSTMSGSCIEEPNIYVTFYCPDCGYCDFQNLTFSNILGFPVLGTHSFADNGECEICHQYYNEDGVCTHEDFEVIQYETIFEADCVHGEIALVLVQCNSCGQFVAGPYFSNELGDHHLDESNTCTICGTYACDHNWVYVEAKEPNCVESGYSAHYYCTICETRSEEYVEYPVDESSSSHVLGEWEIVEETPSTCTSTGRIVYRCYCENCDYYEEMSEETGLADHVMHEVSGVEATCTSSGYTDGFECENCDHSTCEYIEMLYHEWSEEEYVDDNGDVYHICGRCGETDRV